MQDWRSAVARTNKTALSKSWFLRSNSLGQGPPISPSRLNLIVCQKRISASTTASASLVAARSAATLVPPSTSGTRSSADRGRTLRLPSSGDALRETVTTAAVGLGCRFRVSFIEFASGAAPTGKAQCSLSIRSRQIFGVQWRRPNNFGSG
jgi:hypothetical protein